MEKKTKSGRSDRFQIAFNRIHKSLKEQVKGTGSDAFVELLYSGQKNHSLIRKHKHELHQYAKLRNAIVHEKVDRNFYIAEPHQEVVERIEQIAKEFEKPIPAISIATSPVFYYYEDTHLKDVLKVINRLDYTRFPIYDKENNYKTLLTSSEIIKWMANQFSSRVIELENVRIKDLYTSGNKYFVDFVPESASIFEVEERFEGYHKKDQKLQGVIITKNGKADEKPLGFISLWDLLEVAETGSN
ncbi:CBS domain-containing protein [Mesobacillus harenae]|uniref:CBS domain-containing protein n=1 Tax=Mesobacillus harenae TaxID=2213203 RepID=UPI0015807068